MGIIYVSVSTLFVVFASFACAQCEQFEGNVKSSIWQNRTKSGLDV